MNQPENRADVFRQHAARDDGSSFLVAQTVVGQTEQGDIGNADAVRAHMPRISRIFTVQDTGIADDDIAFLNIIKLTVHHIASLVAVYIEQLQKIVMNMGQSGMLIAVLFVDKVAGTVLRDTAVTQMRGQRID